MIAVLNIDAEQGLLAEGVLGVFKRVEVSTGYGRDVVPVLPVVGEGGADVEDVRGSPGVVAFRADVGVSGGQFVVCRYAYWDEGGRGTYVAQLIFVASTL